MCLSGTRKTVSQIAGQTISRARVFPEKEWQGKHAVTGSHRSVEPSLLSHSCYVAEGVVGQRSGTGTQAMVIRRPAGAIDTQPFSTEEMLLSTQQK